MNRLCPRLSWSVRSGAALGFSAVWSGARVRPERSSALVEQRPGQTGLLQFVKDTTDKDSASYVAPEDRIATFDQDGTLWTEQPLYGQAMFAFDRVGELAAQHPEWRQQQPFQAVIEGDHQAMARFTEAEWMQTKGQPLINAGCLIYGARWRGWWYLLAVAIRWIEFHLGVSDAPAC
jgi:hypothetical protein